MLSTQIIASSGSFALIFTCNIFYCTYVCYVWRTTVRRTEYLQYIFYSTYYSMSILVVIIAVICSVHSYEVSLQSALYIR